MKSQQNLFGKARSKSDHGGTCREGKRKAARPLVTKKPMHLILRSSRAKGQWNFLRRDNQAVIDSILERLARRYGVRVMGFENVGNHLHINAVRLSAI